MNSMNVSASPAGGSPQSDRHSLHLSLAADLDELGGMAEAVEALAEDAGWDDALAMQINLVLEELIANAIGYGYPDGRAGRIEVWLEANPQEIQLRIEDDGEAFDPFAQAAPDLSLEIEERPIGGLGIHLVRSYMDSCVYRREAGRNRVILTKRLI